ncbi:putative flowering time control protein FCA [Rosa chinensis]|uniref:Putative flowering time control protein FCA n=2 Tax=Rosa chinensis TaxID=74649 RepID=A0A2P6RFH4_ROSCH|nr:putative flowering time control protein FCA [Rosa chinensis]
MGLALPLLLGHPSIPTTTLITFPTILFLLTSSTTIPTTTIPTTPLASPIRCRFLYAKGLGNTLIKDFLEVFENPNHAKLYVAQISRTATEDVIRSLFGQFGDIVEVVMLKDKRTGFQQGNCFVKYSTLDAAERAIRALNSQHYFPGEANPIIVKFADGERERLGVQDRLYVCGINLEASNKDIEEIFSPYGLVEDIYILKHNRGCGFVKFSSGDMAVQAIKALNGTFIMRGCAQPLIVRFADPKKPREIDRRGNYVFSSAPGGPYSHEPVRVVSDHSDSIGGQNFLNASYPVQQISQPPIPYLANQEPQASTVMQPTFPPLRPPLQLCRMPIQQTQNTQRSSQSSQVAVTEMQKQHLTQSSGQILGQQQSSQTFSSNSTSAALPSSHEITAPLECDWSEHTCPDGYKYYYNCETCESRWDKPEEFASFEQQLQMQTQPNNPSHHLQSVSLVPSTQIVCQNQQELNQVQLQSETSPVVGPTCV